MVAQISHLPRVSLLLAALGLCLTPTVGAAQDPAPVTSAEDASASLAPAAPADAEAAATPDAEPGEAITASDDTAKPEQADKEPAPAPTATQVTFVSHQPLVRLYLLNQDKEIYLCQGECSLRLNQARYQAGLSWQGGDVIAAGAPFEVGDGPQVLETMYVSRADTRRAGAMVLGIGGALSLVSLIGGLYLMATAESTDLYDTGIGGIVGGSSGLAVSGVIGLLMLITGDEAHAVLRAADR